MDMLKTLKITNKFFLNEKTIKTLEEGLTGEKKKSVPINFIVNIDVSGSMSYDLPMIKKQLKNKLPNLIKEGDTISIVWFSGNRDAGILKEEVEVKSLTNLNELNEAIDRFLRPIGLTAFAKPLDLTKEIIGRIKKNRPNSIFSLIFMTDGGNNDCSWSEVTKSLKNLSADLSSSSFIEYGLYADSRRLTEMSEAIGGEKILASNFDEYEVIFAEKISKSLSGAKKVTVDLSQFVDIKHNICFSIGDDNEILVYGINEDKQILLNSDVEKLYFFNEGSMLSTDELVFDDLAKKDLAKILYSSIYVLSDRTYNTDVETMFSVLGDKYTFEMFNNSFGKQKLNQFKQYIKDCVTDESKRFISGKHLNLVLDENTYCFLNLIDDLMSDENNLFYPGHPDFNYKRIGTKKVIVDTHKITDEFNEKIAGCDSLEDIKVLVEEELQKTGVNAADLKFVDANPTKGYKLTDFVWHESKANLSIRVRYEGYVELPTNKFNIDKIDTFIYRTYTIVKDGILNLSKLPVSLSPEVLAKLESIDGVTLSQRFENVVVIDFSKLPIINRSMVKEISAKNLAEMEWELLKLQANKKVYDYYEKSLFPRKSVGFIEKYGKEAEEWLKTLGITEFSGFAPKLTSAESTDFYIAVLLDTKIGGFSSLPKVEDVVKKLDAGTALKANESLLVDAIEDYKKQIASDMYISQDDETKAKMLQTWLSKVKTSFVSQKRKAMMEIAKIKFGLILSKGWFKEFSNFDENTLELDIDSKKIKFTFALSEEEVKI